MFTPVIMAGGAGTRLWPYSRKNYPKQFLPCIGEKSMLQQTLLRLEGLETLFSHHYLCRRTSFYGR